MCLTPIRIKSKKERDEQGIVRSESAYLVVPCGKCPACKLKRANGWILRLSQQERVQSNALFVTLTYDGLFVPISERGFMTLKKRDLQLFFKRLRKNTKCKTIKYYACGEYGSTSWRPHYHLILFDVCEADIYKAWQAPAPDTGLSVPIGHIHVGHVSDASIAYTTKYICKEKRVPAHSGDDRVPEFSLMSRGIGLSYLTPQMVAWHHNNEASYVVRPGGYNMSLPRYYRDRIFTEDQRNYLNMRDQIKHRDQFNKWVIESGSVTEMYRRKFESIQNKLEVAKQNELKNRNKI